MKSRLDIWQSLLADAGERCSVDSTELDFNTVERRVKSEGDQFLTVTLPSFGKDLEMALSEGIIPTHLFRGYTRRMISITVSDGGASNGTKYKRGRWGVPQFLGGFLDLIFTSDWEVTWEEWNTALDVVERSELPDHNFFPPLLRVPENEDEELAMANAIQAVRQLTGAFSKEKALPSAQSIEQAVGSYVDVDKELGEAFNHPFGQWPSWPAFRK